MNEKTHVIHRSSWRPSSTTNDDDDDDDAKKKKKKKKKMGVLVRVRGGATAETRAKTPPERRRAARSRMVEAVPRRRHERTSRGSVDACSRLVPTKQEISGHQKT